MLCYADSVVVPVVVNRVVQCLANGCESWWTMLCQWMWMMLCYVEPVVVNHDANAVPVGVNHDVLFWASRWESRCERCGSRCESWWVMLSEWLWITVCSAEPIVVNHCEWYLDIGCESLWVMLSQWVWIIVLYAEPGVLESWCVMLSQWVWIIVLYWAGCVGIMVCYTEPVTGNHDVNAVPVGVNHAVFFCASRCEPWRVMQRQLLWIMLCYSVPVGVNHGELC